MSDILQTVEHKPNPLLDRLRIPGQSFRMPSQGLFYDSGELDISVKNGEVEVYPLTAMDEIILSTPDKLLSGKAIVEIISRCIPSVIKPEKLLSKDVDFLMGCLRLVTFGNTMSVSYIHSCEDAKKHDYVVDLDAVVRATKSIDPTTINTDYSLSMPNGQKVMLSPMCYEDVIKLYEMTTMIKSDHLSDEEARILIVGALTNIIKSVDGETNKKMIEEWVVNIPLGWKKIIEDAAQKVNAWGIEFKSQHKCKDCKADIILEVAANPVSFFT